MDTTPISAALVSLATPNLETMQQFYRDLLGSSPAVEIPNSYSEFRLPGLRLGVYRSHDPDFRACLGAVSLCLQVSALEEILSLPCLASVEVSPVREAYHGREVDFCDPDGNRIVLHEPSPSFWQILGVP